MMQRLNRKKESIKVLKWRISVTGFFAGLIWGLVWVFFSYFNFTKLSPSTFVLEVWANSDWIAKWYGEFLSIFILSLLSILIAYIYYLCFRNLTGLLPGLLYGVIIWLALILISSSFFEHIPYLNELDINTVVFTLSLFIVYGVFIGFTISYDFMDQPKNAK